MKYVIKKYIDKIDIYDIIKFGCDNGILVDEDEASILMFYLKNNWEDLIYGNPTPIIKDIKLKIGEGKTKKIEKLFYIYKDKYSNYL